MRVFYKRAIFLMDFHIPFDPHPTRQLPRKPSIKTRRDALGPGIGKRSLIQASEKTRRHDCCVMGRWWEDDGRTRKSWEDDGTMMM